MLTLADELRLLAHGHNDMRLHVLAVRVRRVERALDEIVNDAMKDARLAEEGARVVHVDFRRAGS